MTIGEYVNHPDHKKPVQITQIDGDMIAFTVTAPFGGQHRAWAHVATFIPRTF